LACCGIPLLSLVSLRDITPDTVNCSSQVYLLQHEKKIHKKRTSTKKGERSPIFNEAMIFSVPAHTLQVSSFNLAGRFTIACLLARCDGSPENNCCTLVRTVTGASLMTVVQFPGRAEFVLLITWPLSWSSPSAIFKGVEMCSQGA
jgi:hypothetical protein